MSTHYRCRHFPHPSQLLKEGQGVAALPCGDSRLQETAYQLSEGIVTSCRDIGTGQAGPAAAGLIFRQKG